MTYTYRCPDGHERDAQHGMNEAPVILCEEEVYQSGCDCCIGPCNLEMHRVINGVAFIPCAGMYAAENRR